MIDSIGSYSRNGIYPSKCFLRRRTYIDNVIQANEKALFTPEEQILKGQKEYFNLELDEHKYLLQIEKQMTDLPTAAKAKEGVRPAQRSDNEGGSQKSEKSNNSVIPNDSEESHLKRSEDSKNIQSSNSERSGDPDLSGQSINQSTAESERENKSANAPNPTIRQSENYFFSEVFNIAYGGNTTLNQLFTALRDNLAKFDEIIANIEPEYGPFRIGDIPHSQASILKAKTILGYEPGYDAKKSFKLAVRGMKNIVNT